MYYSVKPKLYDMIGGSPPRMTARVTIEVTKIIPEFLGLSVGDRGKITQIRQDAVHVNFAPCVPVSSACPPANGNVSMPPCAALPLLLTHAGLPELPQPQLASVTGVGQQHTPPTPPPPMDELQRPVMQVGTILPTGTVILGLTTSAPGPKMRGLSQNQCKAKL